MINPKKNKIIEMINQTLVYKGYRNVSNTYFNTHFQHIFLIG